MGRPVARPVKSTGRPTEMAGQLVEPMPHGPHLQYHMPGWADPFENLMGRAGPDRENFKLRWTGPGRGPSSTKLMGRAGPRPMPAHDKPC